MFSDYQWSGSKSGHGWPNWTWEKAKDKQAGDKHIVLEGFTERQIGSQGATDQPASNVFLNFFSMKRASDLLGGKQKCLGRGGT